MNPYEPAPNRRTVRDAMDTTDGVTHPNLNTTSSAVQAAVDQLTSAIMAAVGESQRQPAGPDVLLSVADAAARMSISRTKLYELLSAQRIRSIKVGRRRLVPAEALAEYIGRL
jgi:excisionase family DNA binding protein